MSLNDSVKFKEILELYSKSPECSIIKDVYKEIETEASKRIFADPDAISDCNSWHEMKYKSVTSL